jgi:hypothetical protein
MPESCPYQTRVPINVMVDHAGKLASAYVLKDGRVEPGSIPSFPDKISHLSPEQRDLVNYMCFMAVDIAYFAKNLASKEGEERLRSQDYILEPRPSFLHSNAATARITTERTIASGAIDRYGTALRAEARAHLKNPELKELRNHIKFPRKPFRFLMQLGFGSGIDLQLGSFSDRLSFQYKNIDTLTRSAKSLSEKSFSYGVDRQKIPDVMRASLPALGTSATKPLVVLNTLGVNLYWDSQSHETSDIAPTGKWFIPPFKNKSEVRPLSVSVQNQQFLNRVNTGCPALFPVPGINKVGAIKMLFKQGVNILEDQGAWGGTN